MTRAVDTQRAAERRPHIIARIHFPTVRSGKPGTVTCACSVTVSAFPVVGTVFEDPWEPLSKQWLAHRASVGAPINRHGMAATVTTGAVTAFTRDNSKKLTKAESGKLGAAAGRDFVVGRRAS